MRQRAQLTAAVLVTGAIGVTAFCADRFLSSRRILERRLNARASAINDAVESLAIEDVRAGRMREARRQVKIMTGLPGVAYIRVFGPGGNLLIDERGRGALPAGVEAGRDAVEVHSAVVDQRSQSVLGGVQVGMRSASLRRDTRALLTRALALGALTLLALAAVAWIIGKVLSRRLEGLVEALGRADSKEPLGLEDQGTDSELDRLSRAFNSLHARLLEEEARRAKLERLKSDLSSMLVHDMKHPITVLKAALACIEGFDREMWTPAKRSNLLRMANRAINRENAMIEDLLQVASLDHRRMKIKKKPILLSAFMEDCAEENSIVVEQFQRKWGLEVAPEMLGRRIQGEKVLLKRLIGNLVLNAAEHAPEGTLITLGARLHGADRARVEIFVKDEGPGIPDGIRDSLFKPYATFAESAKNVGLGLAFCKLAAELHSARLELRSGAGRGSTFSLIIPLDGAARSEPGADEAPKSAAADAGGT